MGKLYLCIFAATYGRNYVAPFDCLTKYYFEPRELSIQDGSISIDNPVLNEIFLGMPIRSVTRAKIILVNK